MDALARFEDKLEEAMETSFTRLMRSQLQPVEIAKRLARAMDSERTIGLGEVLAPNRYEVRLSPGDYAAVAPFRQALKVRLAEYLAQHARERSLVLLSPPAVTLMADAAVPNKRPRVTAELVDVPAPPPQPPADLAAGFTAKVPVRRPKATTPATATATPPRIATLISLSDGRAYPLDRPVIALGRSLDGDIILDDPRISRRHAQIVQEGNAYVLRDLKSANGVWVNGAPVSEQILKNKDVISLGGVELIFQWT